MKCERCNGLFIPVSFVGGDDEIGAWEYAGWKCLNCGHVTDPLFMKNKEVCARREPLHQSAHRRIGEPLLRTQNAA
jgi:hypothetical protein